MASTLIRSSRRPANSTSPDQAGMMPEIALSSVLLPAPFAPTMVTISASPTVRSTPCSTSMRPYPALSAVTVSMVWQAS